MYIATTGCGRTLGGLALGLLLLTGCGAPKITAPATESPATEPVVPRVPTPEGDVLDAYLAQLRQIDEGLIANEERAIRRGRDTCLDILEKKTAEQVLKNARLRFTGGTVEVNEAQTRRVVAAVKRWCRA